MECIMHLFAVILLSAVLLNPSVLGFSFRNFPGEPQNKNFDFDYNSEKSENDTLNILSDSSEISINASEYPPDEERQESTSDILTSEITRIEKSNSTLASSSPVASTKNTPDTQSTGMENILTEVPSNGTNSTSSVPNSASSPPSTAGQTLSSNKPTSLGTTTSKGIIVSSTEDDEEQEGVVREKPSTTESTNTTTSKTETIYQKALALISDTYTLSILIPVAAGIVFASTIIVTIAICKCFRRKCRRRRLRRKALPDSVKNLRPSDRARLLAESSDEEF